METTTDTDKSSALIDTEVEQNKSGGLFDVEPQQDNLSDSSEPNFSQNRFSGLLDLIPEQDNLSDSFESDSQQNRFSGLIDMQDKSVERDPRHGEIYAFPKKEYPEPYNWMIEQDKMLQGVLNSEMSMEDLLPWDIKYDYGRIIKMTEVPSETEDKIKLSIIYKSLADIDPKITFNLTEELNKTITGKKYSAESLEYIKERYEAGKTQVQLMDLGFDILNQTWDDWSKYEENIEKIQELQSEIPKDFFKEYRFWLEKMIGSTSEQLPIMGQALKEAPIGAGLGGLIFGLSALASSVLWPTIGEEPIVVPAATLKGIKIGAGIKGAMRIAELEAGGMFLELASLEDKFGNKINPKTAVVASFSVGAINGAIELAEWTVLLKTFGISGKLFKKSIQKVTHRFFVKGTIKELVARKVAQYGVALSAEVLQELEQETTNIVFAELAKELNNARKGTKFKHITAEELKARYYEVAKESTRSFGLLVGPGTTITGIKEYSAIAKTKQGHAIGQKATNAAMEYAAIKKQMQKAESTKGIKEFSIEVDKGQKTKAIETEKISSETSEFEGTPGQSETTGTDKTSDEIQKGVTEKAKKLPDTNIFKLKPQEVRAKIEQYKKANTEYVVSPDKAKWLLEGYDPKDISNEGKYNKQAGEIAGKAYDDWINTRKGKVNNTVLFMGGGAGSGKSTTIEEMIGRQEQAITVDTTLSNRYYANKRIDQAIKAGYQTEIWYVYREPADAWKGIWRRYEKGKHFVEADWFLFSHIESKKNVLDIAAKYGDNVRIRVFENRTDQAPKEITIDQLRQKRYNVEKLRGQINEISRRQVEKHPQLKGRKEIFTSGSADSSGRTGESQTGISGRTEAEEKTRQVTSSPKQAERPSSIDNSTVKPVTITGNEIRLTGSRKTNIGMAKKYGMDLRGLYKNEDTGWDIYLLTDIINNTVNHAQEKYQFQSVAALPKLIEKSKKIRTEASNKPGFKATHTFQATLKIGKEIYQVEMVVLEKNDGTKEIIEGRLK